MSRGGVPGPGGYLPRYSPLWTEFLTHASENITLPQTSFAGGKNRFRKYAMTNRKSIEAFKLSLEHASKQMDVHLHTVTRNSIYV